MAYQIVILKQLNEGCAAVRKVVFMEEQGFQQEFDDVDDASVRHIGPTAQDFYAAFGVGQDDTHLAALDTSGVALAAIQELATVVLEKDAEIAALQA